MREALLQEGAGAVGVAGGLAEGGGEGEVEGGGSGERCALDGDAGGEGEIAGEQGGGRGDVVKLGEGGFALEGALDAFEALGGLAEVDLAGAAFGFDEGGGAPEGVGAGVVLSGAAVVLAVEVGIAEGLVEDDAVGGNLLGLGQGCEGELEAIEAQVADADEEPGLGVVGIDLGGLGEVREGALGGAVMLQLDEAELEVGSGIGGVRAEVLDSDSVVEIVLAKAGLG